MTNKEMLAELIKLAKYNGYKDKFDFERALDGFGGADVFKFNSYYAILFDHDFAKAIFGEEKITRWICLKCEKERNYLTFGREGEYCSICGIKRTPREEILFDQKWKKILQGLVITPEEDLIKYYYDQSIE